MGSIHYLENWYMFRLSMCQMIGYVSTRRAEKTCEGSLHPQPKGRGIRDPPRSRCNKIKILFSCHLPDLVPARSSDPERVVQYHIDEAEDDGSINGIKVAGE